MSKVFTYKCFRECNPPNSAGTVPLKLLSLKSNTSSDVSCPNCGGTVPDRWFLARSLVTQSEDINQGYLQNIKSKTKIKGNFTL